MAALFFSFFSTCRQDVRFLLAAWKAGARTDARADNGPFYLYAPWHGYLGQNKSQCQGGINLLFSQNDSEPFTSYGEYKAVLQILLNSRQFQRF